MRDLSWSPKADHHELFDRVVAIVALGDTDDHLRNHGFLADRGSWALSPVFDVNPQPDPQPVDPETANRRLGARKLSKNGGRPKKRQRFGAPFRPMPM